MNKGVIKKQIVNLNKIREIIRISKFDTIQKLKNAINVSNNFFEIASKTKDIINYIDQNILAKEAIYKRNHNKGNVWVFISLDSEILPSFSEKLSSMIKQDFDFEKDKLIIIGHHAINFAEKYKIKPLFSSKKLTNESEIQITSILLYLVSTENVDGVKFVLESPRIIDKPAIIFPIGDINFLLSDEKEFEFSNKTKVFPSANEAITNLSNTYIEQIAHGFLLEAKYYHLKEKLIKHENSLKQVDKIVDERKRNMNKINRKIETEEMIFISSFNKRNDHD